MLVMKVFRPEKVMFTLATYISKYLGSFFLESPNVSMKAVWEDSDSRTPIIFVLSPGADPTVALLKLRD
jgi:dynein heavy chain